MAVDKGNNSAHLLLPPTCHKKRSSLLIHVIKYHSSLLTLQNSVTNPLPLSINIIQVYRSFQNAVTNLLTLQNAVTHLQTLQNSVNPKPLQTANSIPAISAAQYAPKTRSI
jgi:hypothetical protein